MARRRAAPLGPDYRESVLWHEGVERAHPAPGRLPTEADVVVVGGGYCGLMAAAELTRRGRHVVVLEAEELGVGGASTRNGGMVIPELKYGPRALTRKYGPLGREMAESVFDACSLVARLVDEHGIACDYQQTGGLLLAHHDAQVAGLRESEREWVDDLGRPAHFVDGDALHEEIGSSEYVAGLVMDDVAGIQPAKYHAGLVRIALDAGVELHDRTAAEVLEPRARGGWRVATTRGVVLTKDVLVATNAYIDGLVPPLKRRVLPVGSFIIATGVLDEDVARAVIPRGRMVFDTRNLLAYWRLSPDRRMVFGGRTSLAPMSVAKARDRLYEEMVRIHPQLDGMPLDFAWGGHVAITFDRMPHFGRVNGVAYATGCNGTGIALATWFGERAAAWIADGEPPPVFAHLKFPKIPMSSLRRAYLPAVGQWFRAMDRAGR
ncbi:MAG: FAD-binding oxidoreductase [Acidimicrobiia bacterium]|nr:FAD-binding oxidoreductase [Acidimicrobiia bacterium]